MKLKKISAVVLSILLCVSLASCSGLDAKVSEKLDVTQIGEEQQQSEEILHEKIELADSDNNKLTVVPLFNRTVKRLRLLRISRINQAGEIPLRVMIRMQA